MAFRNYWYQNQIREYMLQFVDIFTGLRVQTGKRANGQSIFVTVPIRYASQERMTNMLSQSHGNVDTDLVDTINTSVPIMSAYMSGLSLIRGKVRNPGIIDRSSYMTTEDFAESPDTPDHVTKIRVKARPMPTPYMLNMNVHIYASNTDQHLQILEQLMMIFNPDVTLQTTDSIWDATALTTVTMTDIGLDSEIPIGTDTQIIGSTLAFEVPIWISGPMITIRNGAVKAVRVNLKDGSSYDGDLDDLSVGDAVGSINAGTTSSGIDIDMIGEPVDTTIDNDGNDSEHIIPE